MNPGVHRRRHEELTALRHKHKAAVDALMVMFEQYCDVDTKTNDGKQMFRQMHMTASGDASKMLLAEGRITADQLVAK